LAVVLVELVYSTMVGVLIQNGGCMVIFNHVFIISDSFAMTRRGYV